jgi:hypothetical protein
MGADHTPVHLPPGATRVEDTGECHLKPGVYSLIMIIAKHQPVPQDEEAELRALQAELAM